MKKIFLLVFSIFILTSCSGIKIIIEKDCKCEDTNKNSQTEKVKNSNEDDFFVKQEENIQKPKMIRYFTGKFTLNGDKNYFYVYYKDILVAKFEKSISNFTQDELEENPLIKENKDILNVELAKKIKVKKLKQNFYVIKLENSFKKFLFDIKNKKSWDISFVKSPFEKIIFGRSGKYLMYSGGKKCNGGLIYINNETFKLKKVFENDCNYIGEYPENYKEITNFELGDGVIKVYYIDNLGDKNIEKILLEDIK